MIGSHETYQTARIFVMVTPEGKFTLVQVAVALATVPDKAPQVALLSGAFSEVRYKVTVVVVGIFCVAMATVTGAETLMVTSGTIGLAVGTAGAVTPFTLTTCTVGVPLGSGGLYSPAITEVPEMVPEKVLFVVLISITPESPKLLVIMVPVPATVGAT